VVQAIQIKEFQHMCSKNGLNNYLHTVFSSVTNMKGEATEKKQVTYQTIHHPLPKPF
jgi:hypothetical protein